MERIQHAADVDQQRVVVRPALACAGQHGLEAAGLGCGRATHVERMHHGSQARETPIVLQAEARQQYLERHPLAHVRESRAVEIETQRIGRAVCCGVQPQEARVRVDKTLDQPGTRHAVHPEMAACGPDSPLVLHAITPSNAAGHRLRLAG